MTEPWELLREERITAPAGFMHILARTYRLPDGEESRWDILERGATVAVLALTADEKVVLVRQFRPGPGQVLDELPAGHLDQDEVPEAGAARELLEETGYTGEIELLGSSWLNAMATNRRHVAVARNCVKIGEPLPDAEEFLEPHVVSLPAFRALLRAGALTDTDLGYIALDHLGLL